MSRIRAKFAAWWRFLKNKRLWVFSIVILLLSAVIVGLDNPTGIILGWLAVDVLLLAIARKWRRPWYFLIMIAAAFLGAIFLSFLYSVVALSLAKWIGGVNATDNAVWRVFHMFISNIILLGTPMGILFGFVGFVITGVFHLFAMMRRRRAADGT